VELVDILHFPPNLFAICEEQTLDDFIGSYHFESNRLPAYFLSFFQIKIEILGSSPCQFHFSIVTCQIFCPMISQIQNGIRYYLICRGKGEFARLSVERFHIAVAPLNNGIFPACLHFPVGYYGAIQAIYHLTIAPQFNRPT
jgi:hypothetical protein